MGNSKRRLIALFVAAAWSSVTAWATTYDVGPGQTYINLGDVPWYTLGPGDTVNIHYRSAPYHEKILISARGTSTQWVKILGVPGPNGELPIISGDGATTGNNMHYYWTDPGLFQVSGVVQVAINSDHSDQIPAYIEIANLQIQDAYSAYSFTAENGTVNKYGDFCAGIYVKSGQHILLHDNVITNCGLAIYNWTGGADDNNWWEAVAKDMVIRANYFYNNGIVGSYTEHQTYTESEGVVIEYNHYGPMRVGCAGSQLKDRSCGTIIRYNYIEQSAAGWDVDLVEPQEGFPVLGYPNPLYGKDFFYGNIIVSRNGNTDFIHWNEDQYSGQGRARYAGDRLTFYDNTILIQRPAPAGNWDMTPIFNTNQGGFDCGTGAMPGVIDYRNNIFLGITTAGAPLPYIELGYCGTENFNLGNNWITTGFIVHGATVTGGSGMLSPSNNDPGFLSAAANDLHLTAGSSAIGIAGALAPEVTNNPQGLDLTPTLQYKYQQQVESRTSLKDAGAFQYAATPTGPPTISQQPRNQSVNVGQTATFAIIATGNPYPGFQWMKNNANISGATGPTYVTPAAVESDNGSTFVCVVTNSFGSVTSSAATLTINGAGGGSNPQGASPVSPKNVFRPAKGERAILYGCPDNSSPKIINREGQAVASNLPAQGNNLFSWDGSGEPTGIYESVCTSSHHREKIALIK